MFPHKAELDRALDAIDEGRHAEALAGLLAFYRAPDAPANMRGSYCVHAMRDLGKDYPPAMEALLGLRHEAVQHLLSGSSDDAQLEDVLAIDKALGDMAHSCTLLAGLDAISPQLVRSQGSFAVEVFADGGEFELARKYMGDPVDELRFLAEVQNRLAGMRAAAGDSALRRLVNIAMYVRQARAIESVLQHTGDARLAGEIRALAPGLLADEQMRLAVQREYEDPGSAERELQAEVDRED